MDAETVLAAGREMPLEVDGGGQRRIERLAPVAQDKNETTVLSAPQGQSVLRSEGNGLFSRMFDDICDRLVQRQDDLVNGPGGKTGAPRDPGHEIANNVQITDRARHDQAQRFRGVHA